jgi:hypothetical protein
VLSATSLANRRHLRTRLAAPGTLKVPGWTPFDMGYIGAMSGEFA